MVFTFKVLAKNCGNSDTFSKTESKNNNLKIGFYFRFGLLAKKYDSKLGFVFYILGEITSKIAKTANFGVYALFLGQNSRMLALKCR